MIDGDAKPLSLMKIVKNTLEANRNNSIIAFCDNSSGMPLYNHTFIKLLYFSDSLILKQE